MNPLDGEHFKQNNNLEIVQSMTAMYETEWLEFQNAM